MLKGLSDAIAIKLVRLTGVSELAWPLDSNTLKNKNNIVSKLQVIKRGVRRLPQPKAKMVMRVRFYLQSVVFLPQLKILPQVNSSHLFVVGEFLGIARFKYGAFEKQVGTICYGKCFVHIVVGD
jgi:hypothetical protein